jgi:hypothetical protein
VSGERGSLVRERLARLLRSMELEDLEERVAPVKCAKHPDNPACDTADYGVPLYMAPSPETPPPPDGSGS